MDEKLVTDYENKAMESIKQKDSMDKRSRSGIDKIVIDNVGQEHFDHLGHDEENEEFVTLEQEHISSQHSSIITDKYQEDMDAPTVANKIANMIIDLECKTNEETEDQQCNPDPDEIFYSDDEVFQSDDEVDSDTEDESSDTENDFESTQLSYEELLQWNKLNKLQKNIRKLMSNCEQMWTNYCRCSLGREIGFGLENTFELENMILNNSMLESLKSKLSIDLKKCISKAREYILKMDMCTHSANDLNSIFKTVITENKENPSKTLEYVKKQTKLIKQNASKIFVAPGEGGDWKSWQSDLFLEEKLFPALFPYGIGGYMSSNMLRECDMGFANYVKNRLLSADEKFRNDPSYVFFL